MITLVVAGLAVLIVIVFVWSRIARGRADSRSMEHYEHGLRVLGDVAKRSDAAARIKPVSSAQAEHGHVRTERPAEPAPATEAPRPEVDRPKIREMPSRFEDDSDAFERFLEEAEKETVVPNATASPARAIGPPPSALRARVPRARSTVAWGRIASIAAAVLVAAALVVAGVDLASGGPPRHAGVGQKKHHQHHHASTQHPTTSSTPSTTTPSVFIPVSTSPADVAFTAPSGPYTVSLDIAGGVCWIGIQQVSGGPYVWEQTLYSGQTENYKATGTLVIRVGAPRYLSMKVNGLPARLPAYVQPYDVTFDKATTSTT
ncbi:MAG: RodZ domain-containing protein [Acidimicrobiales bacterium]